MALFKQLRGSRSSLDLQPLTDGYAYFCVDDGTFHIDFTDENGVLKRKQINAKDAETLGAHTPEEFLLLEDISDFLAQAKASGEFDGEDGVTPHIGDNGNWWIGDIDTGIYAKGNIIDVVSLPTSNLDLDSTYRVPHGTFILGKMPVNNSSCHVVKWESVPTEPGESVIYGENSAFTYVGYYNINNNTVYGYFSDETISYLINWVDASGYNDIVKGILKLYLESMSVGWKTMEEVVASVGSALSISWGGVITSAESANDEDKLYLHLSSKMFFNQNGEWVGLNNGVGMHGTGMGAEVFNHPDNVASGMASHAEGYDTQAVGDHSHAEGFTNIAYGPSSHVEGEGNESVGYNSHAEGERNKANGKNAHAEGCLTSATGDHSHAEGYNTQATASASHAGGVGTIASAEAQTVIGKYNATDTTKAFIVGNGTKLDNMGGYIMRTNAMTVDWNGNAVFTGTVTSGGKTLATQEYVTNNSVTKNYVDTQNSTLKSYVDNSYTTAGKKSGFTVGEKATVEGYNNIAAGQYSHAEGAETIASGTCAHTEGLSTQAIASYSHAEGANVTVSGDASHGEGENVSVSGMYSHGEGTQVVVSGHFAHGEGFGVVINGDAHGSHGEGFCTTVSGAFQHVQGINNIEDKAGKYAHIVGNGALNEDATRSTPSNAHTIDWDGNAWFSGDVKIGGDSYDDETAKTLATQEYVDKSYTVAGQKSGTTLGEKATAEGVSTTASGANSHAEGQNTTASNINSHAEGNSTTASGLVSHAEGDSTTASGNFSHAEGSSTTASGTSSHAEGALTIASGVSSHAEGSHTNAYGDYSHAEGVSSNSFECNDELSNEQIQEAWNNSRFSLAKGYGSHVEGFNSLAINTYAHAEGYQTISSGIASHAEGRETIASGSYSHAEGYQATASSAYSHAEGASTNACGTYTHAEGSDTTASGTCSHAEGGSVEVSGSYSHGEGRNVKVNGNMSHGEGDNIIVDGNWQHVSGKYNTADTTSAVIIGNGDANERRNAHTMDWSGNAWFSGNIKIGGTGYDDENATVLATQQYVDDVANDIAENVTNEILNGSGGAYETLKQLSELIDASGDAIESLETMATSKADVSALNAHTDNKSNPHEVTLEQLGVTATAAELNVLDGVTATSTEINVLDGITATTAELNYVDGVTSNIQVQLDERALSTHAHGNITHTGAIGSVANKAVITGTNGVLTTGTVPVASGGTGATTAETALVNLGLTATATEINVLDGITATTAELNYTHGVTSNIQIQLDGKAGTSHGTHVTYSTDAPVMDGVASAGVAGSVARADHIHPTDTSRVAKTEFDEHTSNADAHVTGTNKENLEAAYAHSQSAHARIDATNVMYSNTNGNILVNGAETLVYTHPNSSVSAGTYRSVLVSEQGHVIGGSNPTTLTGYGITDAETKTDASKKLAEAKTYADTAATKVKNDLLNGAGAAYDTLKDLGDLINVNVSAIDALEVVAASKASASDLTAHTNNKSNPHGVTLSHLGVNATAAEINVLDGITATTTELNYVDGVTSNIQTQLNGKAATSHGTHVTYSTTAPVMDGTASAGTATTVARSDHKHPVDTSRVAKTDFDTHTSNTTAHVSATDRANWNGTLASAKSYTDSQTSLCAPLGLVVADDSSVSAYSNLEDFIVNHAQSMVPGGSTVVNLVATLTSAFEPFNKTGTLFLTIHKVDDDCQDLMINATLHSAGEMPTQYVCSRSNGEWTSWDLAGNAKLEQHVADSNWTKIYDSGSIDSRINSFMGIDVTGYKKLKVAIKCVNTTASEGTSAADIAFMGEGYIYYYFSNLFPSLITKSTSTSSAMVEFTMADGFVFCDNVVKSSNANNMFSSGEGMGVWNMTNLGGGIMTCNSPFFYMDVSAANDSTSHYFGEGSRVIVWGCK